METLYIMVCCSGRLHNIRNSQRTSKVYIGKQGVFVKKDIYVTIYGSSYIKVGLSSSKKVCFIICNEIIFIFQDI